MSENSTSKNFPNGLLIYNITKVRHEGANHPKKRNYPSPYAITKFSSSSKPYHKYDPTQHAFLEDLTMYITMYLGGIFKIVHDLNLVTYGLFS